MYSPKIDPALIPVLYRLRVARRIPMTRLVSGLIRKALAAEEQQPVVVAVSPTVVNEPIAKAA